jgi:hypothetical protein
MMGVWRHREMQQKRLRRGPVQPLRVIDHVQQRLVVGRVG